MSTAFGFSLARSTQTAVPIMVLLLLLLLPLHRAWTALASAGLAWTLVSFQVVALLEALLWLSAG